MHLGKVKDTKRTISPFLEICSHISPPRISYDLICIHIRPLEGKPQIPDRSNRLQPPF